MLAAPTPTPTASTPQFQNEAVPLANQLFREFHAQCFWHSPRDLVITVDLISFVVKGLRTYGGRNGFMQAAKLQASQSTVPLP
jgi:hypothetical protein